MSYTTIPDVLMTSLQAATSAVLPQYKYLNFKKMDAALNFWNLMVSFQFP